MSNPDPKNDPENEKIEDNMDDNSDVEIEKSKDDEARDLERSQLINND